MHAILFYKIIAKKYQNNLFFLYNLHNIKMEFKDRKSVTIKTLCVWAFQAQKTY